MKIASVSLFILLLLAACGQPKKTIDPKFDDALYERVDVNFYQGKKDGQVYIRTGMLETIKDSGNKIIYYYKQVPGIDVASFQKLPHGGYYARDKNHVYTWDVAITGENITILEGADQASFTAIGYRWGKDNHAVYYEDKIVTGLNPAELVIVCANQEDSTDIYIEFIRDQDQLFYHNMEVKVPAGIDIKTISCTEDLMGSPFLTVGDRMYIIRNGAMELYQ